MARQRHASGKCRPDCTACGEILKRSHGDRAGWALGALATRLTPDAFDALEAHERWERQLAARAIERAWPHTAGYRNALRRPCARCAGRDACLPRLVTPIQLGVTVDHLDGAPTVCDSCWRDGAVS